METIINQDVPDFQKEVFSSYALSIVLGRALPSIEDGMKPVTRRIVFTFAGEENRFKKAAFFNGKCLSLYHPHSNLSVFESIVILSQKFFLRNTLIDAQGNNGSLKDPKGYAAERYLELKLSNFARDVLYSDFSINTNKMKPNYDKSTLEPVYLPAKIPMLLSIGNTGIGVGYAVDIPTHNLNEICDATIAKINNPKLDSKGIMKILRGPDYATGGSVLNESELPSIYEKGRGIIYVQGTIEDDTFKGKDVLKITEIPNVTDLGKVLQQLVTACKPNKDGKPGPLQEAIHDIKDLSDKKGINITIIPKKNMERSVLRNLIFQYTDMQATQNYNANVLSNGKLVESASIEFIISEWIKFRINTVRRNLSYELGQLREKIYITNALIKAHKNIDAIIKLIRNSKGGKEDAKQALITKFDFADKEAKFIVEQELYKISNMQIKTLETEIEALNEKADYLIEVLPNDKAVNELIIEDIENIKKKYGKPRLTVLNNTNTKMEIKDLIEEKEIYVAITTDGFIYSRDSLELKEGSRKNKGQNFAEIKKGRVIDKSFVINNHNKLFCLSEKGKLFILDAHKLSVNNTHISNLITGLVDDKIVSFIPIEMDASGYLLTVTSSSFFKKTDIKDYFTTMRESGLIAVKLSEGEKLVDATYVPHSDVICILGTSIGTTSKFDLGNIPVVNRVAKGRPLIRFKADEEVVCMNTLNIDEENDLNLLVLTQKGIGKLTPVKDLIDKKTETGMSSAHLTIKLNPGDKLLKNNLIRSNELIVINTKLGKTIKIAANEINVYSRTAKGNKIITLNENDLANSVNIISE